MAGWANTGCASDDVQLQFAARLESQFQILQIKQSLKFSCLYFTAIAVSTTVYWLQDGGNSLPIACAGVNASFALCAIGCHFCRYLSRTPLIFHSLGLLTVSMLASIAHPEVQHYIAQTTDFLQPFGPPPNCSPQAEIRPPRCDMAKSAHESIMLLQLVMTYHILFLMRFRTAIIFSVPSIILYIAVTMIFGSPFFTGEWLRFLVFSFSMIIVLIAKFSIESSQRIFFFEAHAQRVTAVHEKVLRCEAEFRSERLQEELVTSAPQDHGTRSNKSVGAPSSAGCFITTHDESDPCSNLQRIQAIGQQEHWLLDSSSIMVYRNQVLGRGGFGIVLKGSFCRTSVALKLSLPQCHGKRDYRNLFSLANELRILRRLRHPNVVLFHGASIDSSNSQLVLVIELVHGKKLETWIQDQDSDSEIGCDRLLKTEVAKQVVLLGVSSALSYLHGQSPCIVHGDIKASNIMIEELANEPRAKLLDFGLSRLLTPSADHLGGTWRWMAPEVAKGRCHPTSASDVFSFGRLMYFIVTEQLPFADYGKRDLRRVLRRNHSSLLLWPNTGAYFLERCRLIAQDCMHFRQEARPRIIAVHDRILVLNSLSRQPKDVQDQRDEGDAVSLCEIFQDWREQKPCTRQREISASNLRVQPTGASASFSALPVESSHRLDTLPQSSDNNLCHRVADVLETCELMARDDVEVGRLEPTPIRTKLLDLLDVLAQWHDAPTSDACCPWHNSLRGLEQVLTILQKRCAHDWGDNREDHQCPECLRLTGHETGLCPMCQVDLGFLGSGVNNRHEADNQLQLPIQTKYKL